MDPFSPSRLAALSGLVPQAKDLTVFDRTTATLTDTAGVANRLQSLVERLDGPSPNAQSNTQEGPPPGLLNVLSAEEARARENISRSHELLDVIERLLS